MRNVILFLEALSTALAIAINYQRYPTLMEMGYTTEELDDSNPYTSWANDE